MKKETIIKLAISIIIAIIILCAEFFGLKGLKNYEILFCSSNQSIDIKEELSILTGALPSIGSYSVKAVTKADNKLNVYYMYDGKISNYSFEQGIYGETSTISQEIAKSSIDGEIVYYCIIATSFILLGIIIAYILIAKNPIKGILKIAYFVFALFVFMFLYITLPMLSKNRGGNIYYYTLIFGTYLIGLIYGFKNKAFFIPTILMMPILIIAKWFNYRHALLTLDNICAYLFLNFIGGLTARILVKHKGMKKRHFAFYAILIVLLLIGMNLYKLYPRTATSMISSCCEMAIYGIVFSIIAYFVYIIVKKIKEHIENAKENSVQQTNVNNANENRIILELIVVIFLILAILTVNVYFLKANNYIDTNLQSLSEKLKEQYAYKVVQQEVFITNNYGEDWTKIPADFSVLDYASSDFESSSYYMGSNKLIFETSEGIITLVYSDDNGATWKNTAIIDCNGYIVYLNFFDKENGIAMVCVGTELGQREHLRVSYTTNGGKTWTTQQGENSRVRINSGAEIEFTDMQNGRIENINYDGTKTIYTTQDAGLTWQLDK